MTTSKRVTNLDHCGWWWLSFADTRRPEGDHLLGTAIVYGDGLAGALKQAWHRRINPGGEVLGTPLTELVPTGEWRNRLLNRQQSLDADEHGEPVENATPRLEVH